jgi:hypothetical protein
MRYVTHYGAPMARGPKPKGEKPMTPAERQTCWRAARADTPDTPAVKLVYRRPVDRRGRNKRWEDVLAEIQQMADEASRPAGQHAAGHRREAPTLTS